MQVRRAEQILELRPPYTEMDVARAFRRLSKERHPDRPTGSHEAFKELSSAKDLLVELLSDDDKELRDLEEMLGAPPVDSDPVDSDLDDDSWMDTGSESIGRKLSVLHIQIDGRVHPAPQQFRACTCLAGKKKDILSVAFHPPSHIKAANSAEFVVLFDGDGLDEAIFLRGDVVERSYDSDSMISMFCIALEL